MMPATRSFSLCRSRGRARSLAERESEPSARLNFWAECPRDGTLRHADGRVCCHALRWTIFASSCAFVVMPSATPRRGRQLHRISSTPPVPMRGVAGARLKPGSTGVPITCQMSASQADWAERAPDSVVSDIGQPVSITATPRGSSKERLLSPIAGARSREGRLHLSRGCRSIGAQCLRW
jgi:hypothetical protein